MKLRKVIIASFFILASAFAWLPGWDFRKPITITENSGNTLTDYQVLLTIDTASLISAGKLNSDCSDLRFTDSGDNLLPYWIEEGCNTANTKVWVKVPSIPASGSTTIYMYYGKTTATSESNANAVFDFVDDINYTEGQYTTTVGNWVVDFGSVWVVNDNGKKVFYFNQSTVIYLDPSVFTGDNYAIEAYVKLAGAGGRYWGLMGRYTGTVNAFGKSYFLTTFDETQKYLTLRRQDDGSYTVLAQNTEVCELTDYTKVELKFYNNEIIGKINGCGEVSITDTTYTSGTIAIHGHGYAPSYWEKILIRKYVNPEPETIVGQEETTAVVLINFQEIGFSNDTTKINYTALPARSVYFDFEDTTDKYQGKTIILYNAQFTDGYKGQAVEFQGADGSYGIIEDGSILDLSNNFTISFWINLEDNPLAENIYVLSKQNAYGYFAIRVERVVDGVSVPNLGVLLKKSNGVTIGYDFNVNLTGAWHFVTYVHDALNQTLKVYIDGELVGTLENIFMSDIDAPVVIGSWTPTYGNMLGAVDELRIFNFVLDADEVKQLYEEEKPFKIYVTEKLDGTVINESVIFINETGTFDWKMVRGNYEVTFYNTKYKFTFSTRYPVTINSITWIPDPAYKNEEITFSADVFGGYPPYSYSWNFGDGQTGSGNPATHTYTSAGTFQVNLTVKDSYGHQTYLSVEVPVYYLEVSISHDHEPVLNNETLTLKAVYYSSNPAKNESFYWDFGDGSSLVKTIQPAITHVYYTTSDSQSFTACVNYSDGFRNATACQDITVYKPRLTDCTTLTTTKTLTFHLKKEQDPDSDIESTTERHIEIAFKISSSYGYKGGFAFNFVNVTTPDICIYPTTAEFLANATIQFWASGYSRRNYYLYNAELTNTTKDIYLYLLSDAYSSPITIQVLDASSNGIQGVYVKVLRYYVGEDAYKTVAMGQTDVDGRTVVPLQAYDTYYKFILERNGKILKEIPPMQIYSSTLTFQTALEPGLFWQWYGKIAYDCTFNNKTMVYRCTVSDPTNLMQSSSLVVYKKGLTSDILICNNTVYSTSATLTCIFPDLNSTYTAYLYIDLGQGKVLLHSQVFEFGGIRFNVSLGLIITLMLTLTLSLMGINHPDEVIILSVVGLLLGKIMGFTPISTASLISLIVVAGITIYREGI